MPNGRFAGHLRRVTGGPVPWPDINQAKALPWAEARTGLTLADSQAEAVRLALRSKTTVITGGPGVGKTTIVKTILRILQAKAVTLTAGVVQCEEADSAAGVSMSEKRKPQTVAHLSHVRTHAPAQALVAAPVPPVRIEPGQVEQQEHRERLPHGLSARVEENNRCVA